MQGSDGMQKRWKRPLAELLSGKKIMRQPIKGKEPIP
jgi:hypothetical protein